MNLKSSKTSAPRGAMALVLVPALAVVVLWLGMGQSSLSAVDIQDEVASASVQVPATVVDDTGVAPALKSWEFTRRHPGTGSFDSDGHLRHLDRDDNGDPVDLDHRKERMEGSN